MCPRCEKSQDKLCPGCARLDKFMKWVAGDNSVLPATVVKRGKLSAKWLRVYFFRSKGNRCEKCGWNVWHNGLPLLHVCHKDDDFTNMNYDNLEALCPNCHAVHTYNLSGLTFDGSSNGRFVMDRWLNG